MDLVVLIVLIIVVVLWFKKFSSFIYFLAIVDIFLRVFAFVRLSIGIVEVSNFLNSLKIPISIPAIINTYSTDIFNTVLTWGYVICMCVFEFYIIRTFFKKK